MKNLFFLALAILFSCSPAFAQDQAKESDYERLIRNYFKVEFRKLAIESMNLNEEEINAFTPLYMEYMDDMSELMMKRTKLVKEHREEMMEDDTAKDEAEETADFIENYWEVDIAELELKKDLFDRLEDVIPYQKAVNFFMLEEGMNSRMKARETVRFVPMLVRIDPSLMSYKSSELEDYNAFMVDINGDVSLNHEYTHDGLTKLVNAIDVMAKSPKMRVPMVAEKKAEVMKLADQLTENWKSDKHADKAAQAFVMVADMLQAINAKANFKGGDDMIRQLQVAAKKIDPSVLMTKQADHVKAFFMQAEKTVNSFARQANTKKAQMKK